MSRPKLAIAVDNLGPSQLAHRFITQANNLTQSGTADVIGLYENLVPACHNVQFGVMQLAEGWAFNGVAVATSFSTASKLLRFPSLKKKGFYVWDLEWTRGVHRLSFRDSFAVYGNTDFALMARSVDHARVIKHAWGRPVIVVPDFDLQAILGAMA